MVGDLLQPTHLLFVLVVALLVLGPKRLPEAGRALGRGLRDFRSAISGEDNSEPTISAPEPPPAAEQPPPATKQPQPVAEQPQPPAEQPSPTPSPHTQPPAPADEQPTQVQRSDASHEPVEAVTSGRSDSHT